MTQQEYLKKSFISATGTFLYIAAVSLFMTKAENFFPEEDGILIPIFMLLLFIVSATVTGLLVLYKPIQYYVEGKRKDAVILILSTVGWLIVFLILVGVAITV